jgi:hypothetical protein
MRELRGKICDFPFWRFEVHMGGGLFHCCPTWLPTQVANILDVGFLEAMRSPLSAAIRDSMGKGEFRFCEKEICPYLTSYQHTGEVRLPLWEATPGLMRETFDRERRLSISLCYDRSCNLRCPSCRNELILHPEDAIPEDVRAVHDATLRAVREVLDAGYLVQLNVTGSGDAFASPLYYRMLREFPYHPNLLFEIQTNGVLMEERRFTDSLYRMTKFLAVSVDAASQPVYERVRRGGSFERLRANLDWMDGAIRAGRFPKLRDYKVNFIVQRDNYAEIGAFARWMLSYPSVTEVWFNCIADWGHLGAAEFGARAVWRPEHPEHGSFIAAVRDPILRDPRVNPGNLSEFLR